MSRKFLTATWNCAISIHSITRGRLFLSTPSLADDVLFWIASRGDQLIFKWYDVVLHIVAKPIFGQYFIPLTIHAISREQQFLGQTKIPSERQVKECLLQWSLGEECIYILMVSKSTLSGGFIPDTFNESPWKKQNIKQPMHLCFSRVLSIKSKGMESWEKLSLKLLKIRSSDIGLDVSMLLHSTRPQASECSLIIHFSTPDSPRDLNSFNIWRLSLMRVQLHFKYVVLHRIATTMRRVCQI